MKTATFIKRHDVLDETGRVRRIFPAGITRSLPDDICAAALEAGAVDPDSVRTVKPARKPAARKPAAKKAGGRKTAKRGK